ncbi:apolipoprotein D-like [Atheta coriaria]|uniref:apolipoprotein D-like n=1 Tax=Dalotia coriaria TaxID=877792 RepID=UPI0031F404A3
MAAFYYKYATVIILVPLMLSVVNSIGLGNCPRQPFIRDFNMSRFFGHWYEVERSFHLMELLSTCTTIDLQQLNRKQTNVSVTILNRWTGATNNVEGVATVSRRASSLFLHRRTSLWPNAVAKWLPGFGYYQVLNTDYDNYAIIWTCTSTLLGVGYHDLIWIFGRQLDLDAHSRMQVYEILKTRNIDVDRFTLTNKNCTDDMATT